ncbi:uncharacterized protein [Drosophila kikkawai]|uniref:Uncharacterized protein n=1 Tax=Drosophila kikkawai TaxID=30033 RepID=A0ABM4GFG1_DROKI
MSSHCYILNLPIELLNLVYKYIPSMRDKLNLAKTHCVLGNAFAFHAGNTFKSIKIEDRPIGEWLDILPLCGSSITGLEIEDEEDNVIVAKLASTHCPNVEKIRFHVHSSSLNQFNSLLLPLQNLFYIEIWKYSQNFCVVDTLLQMPNLKHLTLFTFNYRDMERVGELTNLTKLNLCNEGLPIDICKCYSPLKNINSLELEDVVFRMPKDLGGETLWPKIEILKVTIRIFDMPLPYFPTLKHLSIEINNSKKSLSDVFGESVFSYGKTLESLSYCKTFPNSIDDDDIGILIKLKALKKLELRVKSDNCLHDICQLENLEELNLARSRITNGGVIEVIKRSTKLRQLNICECVGVNSDMVEEAVAALQDCPRRSDKPFLLQVSPSFGDVDKSKLGGVLDIVCIEDYLKFKFSQI